MSPSRHIGAFWIGENALLDLLASSVGCWFRLHLPDLPQDACVLGVRHDWQRRAFCLCLDRPSFPAVPDGTEIPLLGHLQVDMKREEPPDEPALVPTSRPHP